MSRTQLEESDGEESSEGSNIDAPDIEIAPMTSDEEEESSDDQSGDSGEEDRNLGPSELNTSLKDRSASVVDSAKPDTQANANELSTSLKRTREEERKKGKAVLRQLVSAS